MEKSRKARLENQERLRRLRQEHGGEIELFCAHDPIEYERLAGCSQRSPAGIERTHDRQTGDRLRPQH